MVGGAPHPVVNRTLSALVVVCMVLSAFAGFMLLGKPTVTTAQAIGDLVVVDDTYVIDGITQLVDGDVDVGAGGELIIRDGTLSVISNSGAPHTVTVHDGGRLTLDHGTLTVYLDQIDPWPFLDVIVDGGTIEATGQSVLMFPGSLTLVDGAVVSLHDSSIVALPEEDVLQYVVGTGGVANADEADDGPSITLTDSTLMLFDSEISDMPEFATIGQPAENLSLLGASTLLAVNSHISVDFGPALTLADTYIHNVIDLQGTSNAYLYGTSFDPYSGVLANRAAAIVAGGESFVAVPTAKAAADTTGQDVTWLQASGEGATYSVAPGELMALETFGSWPTATIDSATLYVRYVVASDYNGAGFVTWALEGNPLASTGIRPLSGETSYVEKSFDLRAAGVTTTDQIETLDINFQHTGTTGDVQFDSISIVVTIGANAYVYRWLNVTVGDEYGVPIPGSTVTSVFTGSTTFGGQPAFYFGPDGVTSVPQDEVLDYMGKTAETFGVTEEDGITAVPLLSDLVSGTEYPNSLFVGSFEITGTAPSSDASTESFSFPAYPAMDAADQSFDVTIEVQGISAESPDPARWLVVPPDLVIENMDYYHAGDIIVASTGTLTFKDATLQLVQEFPYQRTIYVDGTAHLIFDGSVATSALPINIIVQGSGTLEVSHSTLAGINIVAMDDAVVILDYATVDGTITTSWDSRAQIMVYDTTLTQSPVLSGYSRAGFTNTSLPSVIVEDDAVAYIYRWIHVKVYDGADMPLPGANVVARFFVNNTFWASALSDLTGVARLNSLGTIITSLGSTFVGNYRINATYWYDGVGYDSDSEVSVGVRPYTEPLGMNATYTQLKVSSVMPDLYVAPSTAITTDPVSPKKNEVTDVSVDVQNVGTSYAYNVLVQFYDTEVMFASTTIAVLGPGETVTLTAQWTADEPLSPEVHNITVWVDPADTVYEMGETPTVGDDPAAIAYKLVTVRRLADLGLDADDIYTDPSPAVVETATSLIATVHNYGDLIAENVTVRFYHDSILPGNLIGSDQIPIILPTYTGEASVVWTPPTTGEHLILVTVNPDHVFDELMFTNNVVSVVVQVLDHPDLELGPISFSMDGVVLDDDTVGGGYTVTVSALLYNRQQAPVYGVEVNLYVDSIETVPVTTTYVMTTLTNETNPAVVQFQYTAEIVDDTTPYNIWMEVNADHVPVEQSYANNVQNRTLIVVDMREDLEVLGSSIRVYEGASLVTSSMYGKTLTVKVNVTNIGGTAVSDAVIRFGYSVGTTEHPFANITDVDVAVGATVEVTATWFVDRTTATSVMLWALADAEEMFSEQREDNNMGEAAFEIDQLSASLTVTIEGSVEGLEANDILTGTVTVRYVGEADPVPYLDLVVGLYNEDSQLVEGTSQVVRTNSMGVAQYTLTIPAGVESGRYTVGAAVAGNQGSSVVFDIAGVEGAAIPFIMWIIVIVAIVAVVVGFIVYTAVYGIGKLVECGECGAFIPAASKRCPKCGVEFEVGTMKCSECGAWVPAESTECPNCGVKFAGEETGEEDYLEKMRAEYDEMVSKYRELAKAELGKKFSDKKFEEWWKNQPTYITFDDWLAKEEEKRKEGAVPCPVCGTLNPKEATVCHKCGTVFAGEKEAPPPGMGPPPATPPTAPPAAAPKPAAPAVEPPVQEAATGAPPAAAPKMVIRRPIEKKVVPKKIIKTPLGEEKTEENGGTENNQ